MKTVYVYWSKTKMVFYFFLYLALAALFACANYERIVYDRYEYHKRDETGKITTIVRKKYVPFSFPESLARINLFYLGMFIFMIWYASAIRYYFFRKGPAIIVSLRGITVPYYGFLEWKKVKSLGVYGRGADQYLALRLKEPEEFFGKLYFLKLAFLSFFIDSRELYEIKHLYVLWDLKNRG